MNIIMITVIRLLAFVFSEYGYMQWLQRKTSLKIEFMPLLIFVSQGMIVFLAGIKETDLPNIEHGNYCFFLAKGLMRITVYFQFKSTYQHDLAMLYGKRMVINMGKWHFSMKVSSCILFVSLPLLINRLSHLNSRTLLIFLIAMIVVGFTLPDIDLKNKSRKRSDEILYDFSRFTYRLSLYLNSGLPIYQALKESIDKNSHSYFYRNIQKVMLRSETGSIFIDELIEFSNLINMNEINSLVTIITQNIQNGGKAKEKINSYSKELWEKRKNEALKAGEKASVKMVFPLTLGLIGVIVIIITPAILLIKQI
jgi:tight adherence protein C